MWKSDKNYKIVWESWNCKEKCERYGKLWEGVKNLKNLKNYKNPKNMKTVWKIRKTWQNGENIENGKNYIEGFHDPRLYYQSFQACQLWSTNHPIHR